VKDVVSSVEALIDLCLAMVTYDQGRYDKSIQLFDKVFDDNFQTEKRKDFI
jgi:predicted negative regulator of RcsB-dependent stress response